MCLLLRSLSVIFWVSVQASSDPVEFYGRRLHSSFDGMDINDTMLIRIILSRAEVCTFLIYVIFNEDFMNKIFLYETFFFIL